MKFFVNISYKNVIFIDRGLIELLGPLGIVRSINFVMNKLSNLQTGYIYNYLFIFILSIFVLLLNFFFNIFVFDFSIFFILILLVFYITKNKEK